MIKIDFLCVEVNKSTISKINLTTPAEQRNTSRTKKQKLIQSKDEPKCETKRNWQQKES
jgi:hypothetical protein